MQQGKNLSGIAMYRTRNFFIRSLGIIVTLGLLLLDSGPAWGEKDMVVLTQKHTNRLAEETSPYLLQHADNPVNWYPWSQEAFDLAKSQDKPIMRPPGGR